VGPLPLIRGERYDNIHGLARPNHRHGHRIDVGPANLAPTLLNPNKIVDQAFSEFIEI
jgi:hypothetical protein